MKRFQEATTTTDVAAANAGLSTASSQRGERADDVLAKAAGGDGPAKRAARRNTAGSRRIMKNFSVRPTRHRLRTSRMVASTDAELEKKNSGLVFVFEKPAHG